MLELLEKIKAELSVLRGALWSVVTLLLCTAVIAFKVTTWLQDNKVEAKDATIQNLQAQISNFKDKTGGSTPEEAKAKIESLELKVANLMPRILTAKQIDVIQQHLNLPSGLNAHTSITFEMGCSDCQGFARSLFYTLKSVKGWEDLSFSNGTIMFSGTMIPHLAPLEMAVGEPQHLRTEQQILYDALVLAGIKPVITRLGFFPSTATSISVNPSN